MTIAASPPSASPTKPPGSGGPPDPPMSARNEQKANVLGLPSATGLVVGSIVGTGVFTMPAVLAGAGTMGILVLAVIAVGAMLLAVLFGQLTKRVPNSDGGLYAYSRHEFGDFAGYLVGWCYWIQSWAGNAAIVSSWVFYVDALFGFTHPSGLENWGIALVGLVGAGGRQPRRRTPDGVVSERHCRTQVPAPAVRRRGRMVLRQQRQLRRVQRFRGQSVQRYWYRGRGGAVLLHRCRGRGGDGQASEGSRRQRRTRFADRHCTQCCSLRSGDRGGHGPGRA